MCNSMKSIGLSIVLMVWGQNLNAEQVPGADPHEHHNMSMPTATPTPTAVPDPHVHHQMSMPKATADPHAGHQMAAPQSAADPRAGHAMPMAQTPSNPHAGHLMPMVKQASPMNHGQHQGMKAASEPAAQKYGPELPPPTAAALAEAFPDLDGMDLRKHMDTPLLGYLLVDQLEWQDADEGDRGVWDISGWLGYDMNRLWWRSEGERSNGEFEAAEVHLLYGRAISRWWDVVAGIRQDFEPGPGRTYAAVGIQGLAPYWFETQLTLYAGEQGQTAARLEAEYELLLTNRLILQPLVEINAYGQRDLENGIGAGFSDMEAGLRLRYEIRREFAPYVGLNWSRSLGNTADLIKAGGGDISELTAVVGLRMWF